MTAHVNLRQHNVIREDRPDGSIWLRSGLEVPLCAATTNEWLEKWAVETPDRVVLAERSGPGWRTLCYGAALERVRELAAGLLAQ